MSTLKRLGHGFAWLVEGLGKVLIAIPSFLGFFMVCLMTVNVVLRYAMSAPIPWEYEIVQDSFLAIVFLTQPRIFARNKALTVEILTERLSSRTQTVLKIVGCIVGLGFFGLMAKAGWDYALPSILEGRVSEQISHLPVGPVQAMIPLAAGTVCLQLIVQMVRHAAALRHGVPAADGD